MQRATSKHGSSRGTTISTTGIQMTGPWFARLGCGAAILILFSQGALGCAPTVAIEAPKEPIVINMNIKVEHEIRINVDQDLDELFEDEKEIF